MSASPLIMKEKAGDDIRMAKMEDKDAFERLIQRNDMSLYRIARGILMHQQDMEDAYQETLIKAYRGIVHLREDKFFKPWLLRIMINECNMLLRKRKKITYISESTAEENNFEDSLEKLELWKAIQALKEEQRIVVILFYYEGMLQNDIAKMLDIPLGTVKSRLSKARESLKEALLIKL